MNNINYPLPSNDNQSFVLLNIVLSAVKRTVPEANSIGYLPEEDEKKMIKLGLGILNGKTSPKTYSSILIKIIEKIIKKKINTKDKIYLDDKIQRYVKRGLLEKQQVVVFKEKLEKLTNKKVSLIEDTTTSKYIKPFKVDERIKKFISSINEDNKTIIYDGPLKLEVLNYLKTSYPDYKIIIKGISKDIKKTLTNVVETWNNTFSEILGDDFIYDENEIHVDELIVIFRIVDGCVDDFFNKVDKNDLYITRRFIDDNI